MTYRHAACVRSVNEIFIDTRWLSVDRRASSGQGQGKLFVHLALVSFVSESELDIRI